MKIKLEKRGCNFIDELDETNSDVGNYRVITSDKVKAKGGREYILEFTLWRNKGHYRYENKRTGKPLKKAVFEIDVPFALCLNTEFENEIGCWRDLTLEKEVHGMNLSYTLENILKVVNMISKDQYEGIEFLN